MALTQHQKDVFGLAVEALECNGCKAMDHAAATRVQSSSLPGQRPIIEWAVDYLACLPAIDCLRKLVIRAHLAPEGQWTCLEIRQCGGAMRGFYSRLSARQLLAEGDRYLERP
ncbi:hypothetical protein [Desulfuromonas thiophila]|uniref:Uncharacterized protein n=1 Tax=Desulfuromonas thiophila TaxID=57664 RepID=A0A1G7B2Y5_9BACT|nr:hypothetical protein [Desulfuromonas thiophila]SDE21207.1 hypothetical protein SAMN05661003_10532 [Desulfuromonas thiophila]